MESAVGVGLRFGFMQYFTLISWHKSRDYILAHSPLPSCPLVSTSHEPERAPAGGEARAKDNIDEAKKHLHQTPSNSLARKPAQRLAVAFDRSSSFSFAAAITGEGFISFLLRQKAAFSSGMGVGGTRARKAELIFSF